MIPLWMRVDDLQHDRVDATTGEVVSPDWPVSGDDIARRRNQ